MNNTVNTAAISITGCTFTSNTAANGEAMYPTFSGTSSNKTFNITGCTFINNSATNTSSSTNGGGAINAGACTLNIDKCNFTNNTATISGGGAVLLNTANNIGTVISNCKFSGNTMASYGGSAIYSKTSFTANNCLFANNGAEIFGFYGATSASAFQNCTFANNLTKGGDPDTIRLVNLTPKYEFTNCLFYKVSSFTGQTPILTNCAFDIAVPSGATNSLTGISSANFIDATNATVANRDYRLSSASPAIDAGITIAACSPDIASVNRPQGSAFDIGAYESSAARVSTDKNVSALTLTASSDITVSSGELTVNQAIAVRSITAAPGAKLSLSTGNAFTATNGVTLQSDATGTGTLVDNTTSSPQAVTATVNQYLPQGRNWYLSSPITAGTASVLTAAGTASSVSYYNEPTSLWVNSYTGTNNVQFTGTLNTGVVEVPLTKQGSTKIGYNLVANPYPSYLNAMTAINANANLLPTIWYRSRSIGETPTYCFETVNTTSGVGTNNAATGAVTGHIPPMQAFWVKTTSDLQTLTFDNSMRFHAGNVTVESGSVPTTPLKASSIKPQLLRLQVSNGTANDEAIVYFNANAMNGFDAYDSPKMSNASESIPEIYTMAGAEQLVINDLSSNAPNQELALGFTPGAVNTFSIKASEVSNFDADTRIILKDNQANTELDLTDGTAYTFTSDAASTANRFTVVFRSSSAPTVVNSTLENNAIGVLSNANNQISVSIPTALVGKTSVAVYNTLGQRLERISLSNASSVLSNSYSKGIYVVSVLANGRTITRKVVIN